jgi:ubiquinone/menaquinone biosynthesis C-methylase UbiE
VSNEPKTNYIKQDRGNLSDYEQYFAGMDASMQQKIALTTAHFPSRGKIADMGSGSGSGTFDLARLYKDLQLIGVDINPVTVEYSKNHYKAENLTFKVGDIAENVFHENSLDGILDSSVLHHVTSFNNFDISQISKTIKNQVAQLKTGGILIIRDFVIPDEAKKRVFLDLPNDDGKDSGEIPELSTASLFEIFARDFRSSLNMKSAVSYKKHTFLKTEFTRFETTFKAAAEFVLRKDYRDHWSPELLEEYCYYSQDNFEENFRKENLRIVVAQPLWNPWIVENRFVGKFYLSDLDKKSLTFPPTNFLIVGEKVAENEGVQLSEKYLQSKAFSHDALIAGKMPALPTFLKLKAYRHKETNQIYELATRPNQTIDLLPWFENENGQIFVLAKKDFPRPLVNAQGINKNLNRANYSGYLTEPISSLVQSSKFKVQSSIEEILSERANVSKDEILEISEPNFYFTSAGGIDEKVESFLVKIEDWQKPPQEIENYTKFNSAGFVRELDALQVLRASHVGGMFDARLEINIYRLLRKLNRSASSWIGASLKPTIQDLTKNFKVSGIEKLIPEKREVFEPLDLKENKFLDLIKSEFVETDSKSNEIAKAEFEYVVPKNLSKNTVAAIPFFKTQTEIFVGVEIRDLPAPQNFIKNSQIVCVPAWRVSNDIEHKFDLETFLSEKFPKDFSVEINRTWELGGTYFPTPGVTPEIVYPFAVELKAENLHQTDLLFFKVRDLLNSLDKISDAHLLILANRLGHALGFLSK